MQNVLSILLWSIGVVYEHTSWCFWHKQRKVLEDLRNILSLWNVGTSMYSNQ